MSPERSSKSSESGNEVAVPPDSLAKLKHDVTRLQAAVDALPFPMFWKDRESVYIGGNRAFLALAGRASPQELRGLTDYDLPWKREESDAYRADDHAVITSGKAKLNILESARMANGQDRWIETHKMPLREGSGEVLGVVVWFEDVTERVLKQQEEARQRTP